MIPITITVSGPGECISNEMKIVERALREAGYNPIVKDEFPNQGPISPNPAKGVEVTLIAKHNPWGG